MDYYVRRLVQAVVTIFSVLTFSFVVIRLMPGGPMDHLRAQIMQANEGADPEMVNNLVETYVQVNPEQPIYIQYIQYVQSALMGDLGVSTRHNIPVSEIILDALPWTLLIMSISLLLTFGIAIVFGAVMGYREGSRFDAAGSTFGVIMNSIPYYVMGLFLLFMLGYNMGIFPLGGRVADTATPGFTLEYIGSVLHHAALPVASFTLTQFGMLAVIMRGNCIQVLGEDFLRVGELRGLRERTLALKYVGRNAVLPMYTELMISIGFMFGGSVVLEEIFNYYGLGYHFFHSIEGRDYPLMMGAFIVITIATVLGILIADLTYGKIDPRVTRGENG